MASTASPHSYALLSPGGSVSSAHGYQILSNQNAVRAHCGYVVGAVAGGAAGMQAYAVVANPASVTAQTGYTVSRNDVAVISTRGYAVMSTFYPPYGALHLDFPYSENRFPPSLSYGSSGGPGFKTSIFTVDSGVAHANSEWDRLRARYEVDFDSVPGADIELVESFFYGMRGKAVGFRFKDWNDYQIVSQNVVIGDGHSTSFQLFKRYRSGANVFDRFIKKPVRGSVSSLYLDGEEYVLNRDFYMNYSSGIITFQAAPPAGAVGNLEYCEFDVPVRFDTDSLRVSAEDFDQYSISSLSMIEILI